MTKHKAVDKRMDNEKVFVQSNDAYRGVRVQILFKLHLKIKYMIVVGNLCRPNVSSRTTTKTAPMILAVTPNFKYALVYCV